MSIRQFGNHLGRTEVFPQKGSFTEKKKSFPSGEKAALNSDLFLETIPGAKTSGVVPYAAGGLWTTSGGGVGWNIGGGLKMKLTETLAIRAVYRRFASFEEFDWGVNVISFGLSIFF